MLKIVIVTDGPYGDRAYDTIGKYFQTEYIKLEKPTSHFMDEIEIPQEDVKEIEEANILITYTTHPDLTLELVERFARKVDWIIVAAWNGEGFKNQLKCFDNVICPHIMCELEEKGDPIFDEFVSLIGKPEIELKVDDNRIKDIKVIRSSPCGSTLFVAEFLKKKYHDCEFDSHDLPRESGLRLQNYPCRASKIRLFSPEECKKERASGLHRDAFLEAIKKIK